jgi:predicted DNA-binding WGR domain protein
MIKLVKQDGAAVQYWEVWNDEGTLTVHYGTIGDIGTAEEWEADNPEETMKELAEAKLKEGYTYLDEDSLTEFVIQYRYEDDEQQALDARYYVEDLMNECLGWTGNGYCDGGDIGEGIMNIYCFVVDAGIAAQTIKEELEHQNALQSAVLGYYDTNGEFIVVYPK